MQDFLFNDKYICRDYKPEDKKAILELFAQVFEKEMSPEFWDWRFSNNPFGQPIIKLLFDNDLLIGHYAISASPAIYVKGEEQKAMISMTTMVKKEYQGQGIFSFLTEQAYQQAQKEGVKIIWGFPNNNSYHGFVKNFNWIGTGPLKILEKEIAGQKETSAQFAIQDVIKVPEDFDLFCNETQKNFDIIGERSKKSIEWRYFAKPSSEYFLKIARNKEEKIVGYTILKIYQNNEEKIGHIVDLLSANDIVAQDLMISANNFFENQGIKKITCWLQPKSFYYARALDFGFVLKDSSKETFFGAKPLSKEISIDLSKWHFTMGDSDNF